jgi:hypothetical protein
MIKVFKTVSMKGDVEYWATNELGMNKEKRKGLSAHEWESKNTTEE